MAAARPDLDLRGEPDALRFGRERDRVRDGTRACPYRILGLPQDWGTADATDHSRGRRAPPGVELTGVDMEDHTMTSETKPHRRSLRALDWLNIFMSDVQTGVRPISGWRRR